MFKNYLKNIAFSNIMLKNTFKVNLIKPNFMRTQYFNFTTQSPIQLNMSNSSIFSVSPGNVNDNVGSRLGKIRLGRGRASGKGKTSGRGHKGYTARTSEPHRHFEGGQVPLDRRLPKHGFRRKAFRDNYAYINIEKIIYLIKKQRLDPTKTITINDIFRARGVTKVRDGIMLLGRGAENLNSIPPLNIEVSSATTRAIEEIKKNGGSITVIYRTPLTLKYHTKPYKFIQTPLDPIPKFKRVKKLLNLEDKGIKYNFYC